MEDKFKLRHASFLFVSIWFTIVNLLVEMIAYEGRKKLGLLSIYSLVALLLTSMFDLLLVISTLAFTTESKLRQWIYASVGLFLGKFGVLILIIISDVHVLSEHWIFLPYNSNTVIASIELIMYFLSFVFHLSVWIRHLLFIRSHIRKPDGAK